MSARAVKGFLLNGVFTFLTLTLSLYVADQALRMLGLPAPAQVNPPHLDEIRKNIEFQYEFKTNSLGFRYKDIPLKKPENTLRVYLAGDSFTEGMGLNADDTFGAILERRYSLSGREVDYINGGFAGAGPLVYGDIFIKIGTKYHPDGLLLCVYGNDVSDTSPVVRKNPLKKLFHRVFPNVGDAWTHLRDRTKRQPARDESRDLVASVSEEAVRRGIDRPRIEEWKARLPKGLLSSADRGEFAGGTLSTGLLYPQRFTDSLDIDTPVAEAKWRRVDEILSRVVGECRRRRIEVALVFFPIEFQYVPEFHTPDNPWITVGTKTRLEWLTEETELQRRLKEWTAKKGIPFLDTTPALRKAVSDGRKLNYPLDGHWNPEGARATASILGDWIDRARIFSSPLPESGDGRHP